MLFAESCGVGLCNNRVQEYVTKRWVFCVAQ